jgi:hypothetical protein
MTVLRRYLVPVAGHGGVPGHALAVAVHAGERVLGIGKALLGRLAEPLDGGVIVPRHAVAGQGENAEIVLGDGVSLDAGLAPELGRFAVVLLDAPALGIHQPEIGLGRRHTQLGRSLVPLDGHGEVSGHAATCFVKESEAVLSLAVALLGQRLPFPEGALVVALLERLETGLVVRQDRTRTQQRQHHHGQSRASQAPQPSCRRYLHALVPCHRQTMQRSANRSNCSY